MERSRRTIGLSAKGKALAAFADLKAGGLKRSEQYQLETEGDIYEDVDESTYQELVKKRREDDFIEDDDGTGAYVDFGQEDWDEAEYSGDEGDQAHKRAKGAKKATGVFNNLAPKRKNTATERVSSMFLKGSGRDVLGASGKGGVGKAGDDGGDALLDSLLGEIEHDPLNMSTARVNPFKRSLAGTGAQRPSMPSFRPQASSSGFGGGSESGGRSEYAAAPPPKFSDTDLSAERDSPGPPGDVRTSGNGKRVASSWSDIEASAPQRRSHRNADDIEAADPGMPFDAMETEEPDAVADVADDAEPAEGAVEGAAAKLEEDVSRVVPFKAEVESGGGMDWFQVVEEDAAAPASSSQEESQSAAADVGAAGATDSKLPPLEEDDSLRLYWLDAYEDPLNAPGCVFIFGKVRTATGFASCVVSLRNLERNVYVLPRETHRITGQPVSFVEVYKEVQELCKSHKVQKFGCKKVERSYAFEEAGIPQKAEYLKLVYSAEFPALPADSEGDTYRRIFGSHTSTLELLLLKRRVHGPCWLTLEKVAPTRGAPATWAKFEVTLPEGKKTLKVTAEPPPPPPLTVASLHVMTVPNSKHVPEIVMASVMTHSAVAAEGPTANPTKLTAFSAVRKLEGRAWPWDLTRTISADKRLNLEVCGSERALLNFLIARLHGLDADVLVGHNIAGYDMAILLQRMQACKIQHWSKLGRMRIKNMPRLNSGASAFSGGNWAEWSAVAGRLMCDTFLSARELLGSQRSYGLAELARTQLGANKPEVDHQAIAPMFEETAQLLQLVRCCENDAFLSLQLMFKMQVLPLTKQLTNLAGNLWSKSLQGKRAERIEYLLLHEFHRLKYIKPDKETFAMRMAKNKRKAGADNDDEPNEADDDEGNRRGGGQTGRRKAAYAGGLVLEPKRGFYDHYVLLLDFNSLYPSIVQEYNICFTTITRPTPDAEGNTPLAIPPPASVEQGVLPRMIGRLVARRREVKALLKAEKEPGRKAQLDIRQKALKIMANSMYGCLGFSGSRFHARALAELITARGRDALQHAVDIATNQNMEVIYGDTDSVMIHSASDDLVEARKMANVLKQEVNKHYRCMEIDIDGIMKSMLLLKKKKYAALLVEEKNGKLEVSREAKGLDLVRRDWCKLSSEAGSKVLDFILSGKPREEIVAEIEAYLKDVASKMKQNQLSIDKYIITKQLTKAPKDYPDARSQPHVQVAKAMLERGQQVGANTTIEYVVCVDEEKPLVAERAHHPKTVLQAEGMLEIDTAWYMAQQLHPPIWRLCEPIEGLDSAHIAEWLGLDPSKFHTVSVDHAKQGRDERTLGATSSELQRFAESKPLEVRCARCQASAPLHGLLGTGEGTASEWLGAKGALCCSSCGERHSAARLHNGLGLALRKHVKVYYTAPLQCEEQTCRESSRSLSVHVARDDAGLPLFPACTVPRCKGRMLKTVTDRALHSQLLFFKSLFDVEWAQRRVEADNKRRPEGAKQLIDPLTKDEENLLAALMARVEGELERSAFDTVDPVRLFSCA